MISGAQNIFKIPELKRRILWTFAFLAIYRIGVHIPTPGINGDALASFFAQAKGTLFSLIDMFSGGALERLSVFALGIMPYISASIILQLLTVVIPYLDRLQKEGEIGRKKIVQYTRYGTVVLSMIQGFGIAVGLENMRGAAGEMIVLVPGWSFRIMTVITLTAGTAFIMWLGEQITERGIGNGISLIIFAGIVARMPNAVASTYELFRVGQMSIITILFLIHPHGLGRCSDHLYRNRPTEASCSIRQADCGEKGLWWPEHPSSPQVEHVGCHPSYLRLLDPDVSLDDCQFYAEALVGGTSLGSIDSQ